MLEFWWPIRFAPGYEVNEAGIVRRALPGRKTYPGKVISPTKHHFGYPRIKLTIDRKHKTFDAACFRGAEAIPKSRGAAPRRKSREVKSLTKIGAKYGISFQHVSDIVNRKSWAHVR